MRSIQTVAAITTSPLPFNEDSLSSPAFRVRHRAFRDATCNFFTTENSR
jgi:hypothetical protein